MKRVWHFSHLAPLILFFLPIGRVKREGHDTMSHPLNTLLSANIQFSTQNLVESKKIIQLSYKEAMFINPAPPRNVSRTPWLRKSDSDIKFYKLAHCLQNDADPCLLPKARIIENVEQIAS